MDDAEVVEAIAAGELDGLAAALDRYAAALFDSCYAMVGDPEVAAEAVRDTFIVAWCRLDGLRDPGKLELWLRTVAGNECYRHLLTSGGPPQTAVAESPALPDRLPGQVLMACADDTPAGRAERVSIAHRAGPFGRNGFPKAVALSGPTRWRRVRGHPRTAAAVAVVAIAAMGAGIGSMLLASSPRPGHVSAAAPRRGSGTDGTTSSGAALPPGSAVPVSPSPRDSKHSQSMPPSAGTPAAGPMAGTAPQQAVATQPAVAVQPVPPPATTPAAVAQGTLLVSPPTLVLVTGSGTIMLTAQGGPVSYSITIPPGHQGELTVTPSSGSIAAGASAAITVTAVSKGALNVPLTVNPGGQTVVVRSSPGQPDS
jgi:hypothetical protein